MAYDHTAYDYIVVGAGSAGCVLAHRLSADPAVRVLLLEAGGSDQKMEVRIPAAFAKLFKTERDWAYETEPQKHMGGRRLFWPRGKMLGGSSSINAMIYIRGEAAVFDDWARVAGPGWSYEALLPYFKRAENFEDARLENADEYHGTGGPLNVTTARDPRILSGLFIDAAAEVLGAPHNNDFNGATQAGVGYYHLTQKGGRRCSTADAYLRPALKRNNLTVETGACVVGLRFDGDRVSGVNYLQGGRQRRAETDGEVLLAGGAINSPQLLLLSGIGPAEGLAKLDIPVVCDLPVGENLHDHLMMTVNYQCKKPVSLADAESLKSLFKYLLFKKGSLTSNVGEAGGFVKTEPDKEVCDLQFHFAPSYYVDHGFGNPDGHGFGVAPTQVDTQSRGRLWLRSKDPQQPPRIDPRYFENEADLDVLVRGVEHARAIAASPAFDEFRGPEVYPEKMPEGGEGLRQAIRQAAVTIYHPVGTCKMGQEGDAVVDPELRVRGVRGLRVVDASVMPRIVNGNTNAATIAIAEKAADLIRDGSRPQK